MKVIEFTSIAAYVQGTLTSNNTIMNDGDTVTIGNKTYTFKGALTPTEGQVLIDGSADNGLQNLIWAINRTDPGAKDGVKYKIAAAHTQVTADASLTGHTITVRSILSGVGDLAYALSKSAGATTLSWGAGVTYMTCQNITIAATVESGVTLADPIQQVTVGNYPVSRPSWSRALRLTDANVQILRYGAGENVSVAISSIAELACAADPLLSFAPFFTTSPANDTCQATVSSAVFTTVAVSETTIAYQWQENNGGGWSNVSNGGIYSGATTAELTITPTTTGQTGYQYRCVATNRSGTTNSRAATMTVQAAPP